MALVQSSNISRNCYCLESNRHSTYLACGDKIKANIYTTNCLQLGKDNISFSTISTWVVVRSDTSGSISEGARWACRAEARVSGSADRGGGVDSNRPSTH